MELLEALDTCTAPTAPTTQQDVARLRLVCLVRSGDGYLVRAVGTLDDAGEDRRHLDIAFGDTADRSRAGELDAAVRQVQRWCEDGTAVSLVAHPGGITLRAGDGTEIPLPCSV